MTAQSRRPKFCQLLADLMEKEVRSLNAKNSRMGDRFENIKSKLRMVMSKEEIEELCLCLSTTLVINQDIVKLSEIRGSINPPVNRKLYSYKGG